MSEHGWNVMVERRQIVRIPGVRETDARDMVRAWLAGDRPIGSDWGVAEVEATITVAAPYRRPGSEAVTA